MNINFNVLDRQYNKYKNEYDNAVLNVLSSGWYILGKEVEAFEKEFSHCIGLKYCVGLNSGLDALILAFRALDIGYGDEVIVPANTYIASVLGVTENGATPVFVESDVYYNIDASKIEAAITSKTKAILAVHLYGQPAEIKKIKEIAVNHNLFLIEDCAQSHGANIDGEMTGSFGHIGCFSFFPTKNLGAFGDAGAIVTDNEQLYEKIRMLRNYGSKIRYYNDIDGVNSRLDEIQATLLRVKLKHLQELNTERSNLANKYLNGIINPLIKLPKHKYNNVWHLFVILTKYRDELMQYLSKNGIQTLIHYPVPPHLSQCYKRFGYEKGSFPITENYAAEVLSLPMYTGMLDDEINYIIDIINNWKVT